MRGVKFGDRGLRRYFVDTCLRLGGDDVLAWALERQLYRIGEYSTYLALIRS